MPAASPSRRASTTSSPQGDRQQGAGGDGPERERLEKLAPEAHFLGFRHGEDYARTLAAADVMVFPSFTDTFGLVMLEAMACGTSPPTTPRARWTWWKTG